MDGQNIEFTDQGSSVRIPFGISYQTNSSFLNATQFK